MACPSGKSHEVCGLKFFGRASKFEGSVAFTGNPRRQALNEPLVTTMWVLVEVGDAPSIGVNRELFVQFVDRLSGQSQWETIAASPKLFSAGLELFRSRRDKEWSLTDCMSFVVMRERGITDALTNHHHFEQAGFRILLKE
jgi:predicted nucleic acid-binding protein